MKYTPGIILKIFLITILVWESGCYTQAVPQRSQQERKRPPQKVKRSGSRRTAPNVRPPYLLGYGDVLEIRFFNNSEFNVTIPVRPDGRISVEKVGELFVEGKTAEWVDQVITRAYSRFIRDPEVTVIVKQFGSNQVYVLGEVNRPGKFPIGKDMTALQALAVAGGPKNSARLNSVLIIRRAADGSPVARRIDLTALDNRQNRRGSLAFVVRPLDVVFVPRTFIADVANFMSQIWTVINPPLDAYIRTLFWTRR